MLKEVVQRDADGRVADSESSRRVDVWLNLFVPSWALVRPRCQLVAMLLLNPPPASQAPSSRAAN